jgi:hypothetical protein
MKRLEYFGVVSFYFGLANYLFLRFLLWLPILGFILALVGLIIYDTNKHRAKWYAVAGLLINLISLVLGLRDVYSPK